LKKRSKKEEEGIISTRFRRVQRALENATATYAKTLKKGGAKGPHRKRL